MYVKEGIIVVSFLFNPFSTALGAATGELVFSEIMFLFW